MLHVVARSSPQNKYNLVRGVVESSLWSRRLVTAFVGKDLQDVPSLKTADVGFTMVCWIISLFCYNCLSKCKKHLHLASVKCWIIITLFHYHCLSKCKKHLCLANVKCWMIIPLFHYNYLSKYKNHLVWQMLNACVDSNFRKA